MLIDRIAHIRIASQAGAMEPPVLDEQLAANLVPLRATCSESVPAVGTI